MARRLNATRTDKCPHPLPLSRVREREYWCAPILAAAAHNSNPLLNPKPPSPMTYEHSNNYPKLHNAAWPGVVGKGPGAEPPIDLDTMLDLTADAEFEGVRFDGFDLFLYAPHIEIDSSDDQIRQLADKARARNLEIGTVVAPIWGATGGGAAMGNAEERAKFLAQVRKGCRIAERLRQLGIRPNGVVRLDSASPVEAWYEDPMGNQKRIAETFREACKIAETTANGWPRKAKSAGAACIVGSGCWIPGDGRSCGDAGLRGRHGPHAALSAGLQCAGGRHSARQFQLAQRRQVRGRLLPVDRRLAALDDRFPRRPEQRHGTGNGSHDKTGRHCLPGDPKENSIFRTTPAIGSATSGAS